jgi:signal transduction histidine kinase
LGAFGAFVFYGGNLDYEFAAGLQALLPLLRRLRADETLVAKAGELLRRNEMLDEFAGFVAHELKTPLHEALLAQDASQLLHEALELVDALLRTARDARRFDAAESPVDCLESVMRDLGAPRSYHAQAPARDACRTRALRARARATSDASGSFCSVRTA